MLSEVRQHTEYIIEVLYAQVRGQVTHKPRTYRQKARQQHLQVVKQRQVKHTALRKAVGQQLRDVRRNLAHMDALMDALMKVGASLAQLDKLDKQLYRKLLVISELFQQQQWMHQQRQRRIDDRIVINAQSHIRPIVRGKAGTPVEFGVKIVIGCGDGYVFLDHLDWNNFNRLYRKLFFGAASPRQKTIYRTHNLISDEV